MTPPSSSLLTAFRHAFSAWRGDSFSSRPFGAVYLGCETRRVPAEYRWDGLHRGADPRHPQVVFQATLQGWGRFERGPRRWTVGPETAFFALLPSRHVYYLPEKSAEWSFFWLTFAHPYVAERVAGLAAQHPPVFPLPAGSAFFAQSRAFFERSCHGRFDDPFAEEAALLEWMLGLERHLHDLAHPRSRREAFLAEVRTFTEANLTRSFSVNELAAQRGMSRSHYSHQFRGATGLSPAAYVLDVRLAEVRRRLRGSTAPLKQIAAETGFADANHLCKVFQRVHHLTPGGYRSQLR